ncbi:pectin acetylesterase 8-like isoform X2 [Silene latifolia]
MVNSSKWLELLVCLVLLIKVEGFNVSITIVQDAVAKGGVCLDGSPPAYHFDKGFETGVDNWLIYLQGGAWCNNATTCLDRSHSAFGSSKLMSTNYNFTGILSNESKHNPDFYNWNRVEVRYCDGSSYTGDVEAVDPITKVYYRGARAWRAVMDDLLAKGMKDAQNAVLAGCSAGGLGAILQCDNFRALLPSGARVKCLSDGGFFINTEALYGPRPLQEYFAEVVTTHGSAKNLPEACTSTFRPELCIFPRHAARDIQTPLFLLNSAYDSWQIVNIYLQGVVDPHGKWRNCTNDITRCSDSQILDLQGFNKQFIMALSSIGDNPTRGLFINSCYCHCQSEAQETWFAEDSPRLDNTTIAKAFGDWFYDRNPFQKIDCPYPCDKTCRHAVSA